MKTYKRGKHVMVSEVVHLKLKYLKLGVERKIKVLVKIELFNFMSCDGEIYRTKKLINVLWVC